MPAKISMTVLLTFSWLAGAVYASIPPFWLAIHPFAEKWRRSRRSPYLTLVPMWALIIALLLLVTMPWRDVRLYANPYSWFPAGILFVCGASLYIFSSRRFSRTQLMGQPELTPQSLRQGLITIGIHGRVRHPIYLGHIFMLSAWAVGTGLLVLYELLIFALFTGTVMVRKEESELEERFGEAYRQYKKQVPLLLPKF